MRERGAVEFSPRVEEEAVFDSGIVEMEGCLTVFVGRGERKCEASSS